jgi:hypothetical protein
MKLLELFQAVKEENLTKDQLESYYTTMSSLYSDMQLELGKVKKAKAIFTFQYPDEPATKIRQRWEGTETGLREIELKAYIKATSPLLNSLKSRLYAMY